MSQALPVRVVECPGMPEGQAVLVGPVSPEERQQLVGMTTEERVATLMRMRKLVAIRGLR